MKVDQQRPVPLSETARPTPGPWALERDGSVVIGGQIVIGHPDSCGPDDAPPEERKANCRLIAAAPDLLAAAEQAERAIAEHGRLVGPEGLALDALRAALSKATGGVA